MNDRVHARKRVEERRSPKISLDWRKAGVMGGEAGHIPVDRMNRGNVGRRQKGRDQLAP